MSMTGLDVFDTTLQKTHLWLNEIMTELGWEDNRHWAYLALRTVLHTLRDHLTVEEAMDLGAQLPMLIRGFYYEGWTLTGKPVKERPTKRSFSPISHRPSAMTNELTPKKWSGPCSESFLDVSLKGRFQMSNTYCRRRYESCGPKPD